MRFMRPGTRGGPAGTTVGPSDTTEPGGMTQLANRHTEPGPDLGLTAPLRMPTDIGIARSSTPRSPGVGGL